MILGKKQAFIPDREYFREFGQKTGFYSRSGIFSRIWAKNRLLFPIGNIFTIFMDNRVFIIPQ